ncbi:MAG: hypothetical protein V4608_10830 [Bacteroidota bacterium]
MLEIFYAQKLVNKIYKYEKNKPICKELAKLTVDEIINHIPKCDGLHEELGEYLTQHLKYLNTVKVEISKIKEYHIGSCLGCAFYDECYTRINHYSPIDYSCYEIPY